jgi:hypothetical protein
MGTNFSEEPAASIFITEEYSLAASETLVPIYHIPGDHNFGSYYLCEKLLNINLRNNH